MNYEPLTIYKNMANEINRILKLFAGLQHGDCWIGNNFKETLHGIDDVMALKTVSVDTNSIWRLIAHITYWRTRVVSVLLQIPVNESANCRLSNLK